MGLSRGRSDAYSKALDIAHQGRKNVETAVTGFAAKRYVDEGGGARRAGMNTLKALLSQTAAVEKSTDDAFGRNMDMAHQALLREYDQKQAKNLARRGVPPEWGAPVMMPPRDRAGQFLQTLQTGLSIATSVVGLATGVGPALGAIGNIGKAAPVTEIATKTASTGGGWWQNFKSGFAFSDVRLKENISKVGKTKAGYNLYEWNYKSVPNTRYRGVIAQDVMKLNPTAVGVSDGYLTVDYSKIDTTMEVVSNG